MLTPPNCIEDVGTPLLSHSPGLLSVAPESCSLERLLHLVQLFQLCQAAYHMLAPLPSRVDSCGNMIRCGDLQLNALSMTLDTSNASATPHRAKPLLTCPQSCSQQTALCKRRHHASSEDFSAGSTGSFYYLSIAETFRQNAPLGTNDCFLSSKNSFPSSALHLLQNISWEYLLCKILA